MKQRILIQFIILAIASFTLGNKIELINPAVSSLCDSDLDCGVGGGQLNNHPGNPILNHA